jgi:hypothetical protein
MVTALQRAGGALNTNLHFHTLVLDGVFCPITSGCGRPASGTGRRPKAGRAPPEAVHVDYAHSISRRAAEAWPAARSGGPFAPPPRGTFGGARHDSLTAAARRGYR